MPESPGAGNVLQFSSCMFAAESSVENTSRRPVAAVPARPRPRPGARGKKVPYRHVPHRDKPPQLVARRNARERRRVQAVNAAFVRLRQAVPGDTASSRGKRVSKVKTLQRAIEYICLLQELLAADQGGDRVVDQTAPATRWGGGDVAAEFKREDEDEFASLFHDFAHQF